MSEQYHNDVLFTEEQFNRIMERNKYLVKGGQVVCSTCYSECGQCGEGWWMWKCQEYLDAQPLPPGVPYLQRTVGALVLIGLLSGVVLIVKWVIS